MFSAFIPFLGSPKLKPKQKRLSFIFSYTPNPLFGLVQTETQFFYFLFFFVLPSLRTHMWAVSNCSARTVHSEAEQGHLSLASPTVDW